MQGPPSKSSAAKIQNDGNKAVLLDVCTERECATTGFKPDVSSSKSKIELCVMKEKMLMLFA